jgi:hypothetical protein
MDCHVGSCEYQTSPSTPDTQLSRFQGEASQGPPHGSGLLRYARNDGSEGLEALLESCRAVSERAAQTLKIGERNNWLIDFALDHLTLGHAALYAAVLEAYRLTRSIFAANPSGTPWTASASPASNNTSPLAS